MSKQQHDNDVYLFENQKIVDINMEKEVKKSFIEYSMSVIMSRALPDVRDGMKPGQRRVIPRPAVLSSIKVVPKGVGMPLRLPPPVWM